MIKFFSERNKAIFRSKWNIVVLVRSVSVLSQLLKGNVSREGRTKSNQRSETVRNHQKRNAEKKKVYFAPVMQDCTSQSITVAFAKQLLFLSAKVGPYSNCESKV